MANEQASDPRMSRYFGLAGALLACLLASTAAPAQTYPSGYAIFNDGTAVRLEDYAELPLSTSRKATDPYPPPTDYSLQLGRPTSLRSEPANAPLSAARFFVADQNGTLFILDKKSRKLTPYIDFGKIYAKFVSEPPFGMGLVSVAFDPDYAHNGKFYSVHTEQVSMTGPRQPNGASLPGLNLSGFTTTDPINPPAGTVAYEDVVTEWTDTNIKNAAFEGTSREILRQGTNFGVHPMADMVFDPLAKRGDADYGNLYISIGDGSAGERAGPTHTIPQRLDAFGGKIIRITPDLNLRPQDMLSSNGRYRIPSTGPDANPFVAIATARPEIFAYGFRNPHRLSWDIPSNTLIADDIGLHLYEEVDIIQKGGNYGYAEREGPEQLFVGGPSGGRTGSTAKPPVPFPDSDLLTVDGLPAPVKPLYPAAVFSHQDGLAVGAGFVYHGKLLPQLRGKYIFTEIAAGRLLYADFDQMLAVHGERGKAAPIHEIQVMYKAPGTAGAAAKRRMYDIAVDTYKARGGTPPANSVMPGNNEGAIAFVVANGLKPVTDAYGVKYGGGRADVRLSLGGDGELYVLFKTDGWIRKLVAVTAPPPAAKN